MLKWILNAILVYAFYRLIRGFFRPQPPPNVGTRSSKKLDPREAVTARWSEVPDDSKGGDGQD